MANLADAWESKIDAGAGILKLLVKNLDHGSAMTSHSSQGQTADRVLIHVDTELGAKDLLNGRMAYVSVSRGAHDAQLFTNDREKLPAAPDHDVSQQSAHVPEIKSNQTTTLEQEVSRVNAAPRQLRSWFAHRSGL